MSPVPKIKPVTTTKPKRRRCVHAQPIEAANVDEALLTLPTAGAIGGMSTATLRRREASDPTFPRFIKLGARCTRVRAGPYRAWLAQQAGE